MEDYFDGNSDDDYYDRVYDDDQEVEGEDSDRLQEAKDETDFSMSCDQSPSYQVIRKETLLAVQVRN
ncbi:hypothetical protein ACH5RR_041122 [Cinchona calisaya]|uniref:Uncharacterized protein n=1 Tax=Cinchona calisaya TaxID=153742 RepID=A0ABD2XWM2_9GENT